MSEQPAYLCIFEQPLHLLDETGRRTEVYQPLAYTLALPFPPGAGLSVQLSGDVTNDDDPEFDNYVEIEHVHYDVKTGLFLCRCKSQRYPHHDHADFKAKKKQLLEWGWEEP